MALIVEDGTGLADAESLVTLAEARAFAVSRGKSLPEDDTSAEALLRNANDALGDWEAQMQGRRCVATQALPFPRTGVYVHGFALDVSTVPQCVKNAVCQLAIEGLSGDLQATTDGRIATTETVGPMTTVYSSQGNLAPIYTKVNAFLSPVLSGGGGISLRTVRV